MINKNNLTGLGKFIDTLVEISTTMEISEEVKFKLDEVIEDLIHYELDKNDGMMPIDYRDLSPDEMEEIREFEMLVRDVMNDNLAMA
tara:strand:- start:47 stop:307 length:261 start_codon:yes stop_codon:yes gene_type:complete